MSGAPRQLFRGRHTGLSAVALTLLLAACSSLPKGERSDVVRETDAAWIVELSEVRPARAVAQAYLGSADQAWLIEDYNLSAVRNGRVPAGTPIVILKTPPRTAGVWPGAYQVTPILCYHRFTKTADPNDKLRITPARFEAQIKQLKAGGARFVTVNELIAHFEEGLAIPRNAVAITIDDGFESVYETAFPILKKHGVKATLFVYTDFIGAGAAASWDQIEEMRTSGLMDIQAHSKTHTNLTEQKAGESDSAYKNRLRTEFTASRDRIKGKLSVRPRVFAYPYGATNDQAMAEAEAAGYSLAATVLRGQNPAFSPPYLLRRTLMYGALDGAALRKIAATEITDPALASLAWRHPSVESPGLTGRNPRQAEKHASEGAALLKKGNAKAARTAFLKALAQDPENRAAYAGLIQITADDTRRSMAKLQQFQHVRLDPETPQQKPDAAVKTASLRTGQDAAAAPPPVAESPAVKALAGLVKAGELPKALAVLKTIRMSEVRFTGAAATTFAEATSDLSEAFYQEGVGQFRSDIRRAIAAFENSLLADPENDRAKRNLLRAQKIADALY